MDPSSKIAWLALAASAIGIVVACWSAWVAHRSYRHTKDAYDQERYESFIRQRSNLLEVINTSRRILDSTRIDIGTLKAIYDAEPQPVKALLSNYTSLFTDLYPKVETGAVVAANLWDEVAEWDSSWGLSTLVHQEAKFRALLHEDQVVRESAQYMIGVFKEKLELARTHVHGAIR